MKNTEVHFPCVFSYSILRNAPGSVFLFVTIRKISHFTVIGNAVAATPMIFAVGIRAAALVAVAAVFLTTHILHPLLIIRVP